MTAHTMEQPVDPASAATHRHYGSLLMLKHPAEVLHSTPNGVRTTLVRRREPLSVALSLPRRRLGRRVYFDAPGVARTIDVDAGKGVKGNRTQSPGIADGDEGIASTWAVSPR